MLDNIKSIYIFQKLFSFIDEGIKLKLAKYNKRIQNKVIVNLNNYKLYKGKNIIYETNKKERKIKVYDCYNDEMIL